MADPISNKPMTRRTFLETSAGAILAATAAPRLLADTPKPKRPNILFLMDDQHRGDTLGVAGNNIIQTPNLDRLAAEGAYFPKAHVSVPSCIAARASLLTGMSPWGHGLLGYADQPKKWPYEKPQALHDAGYSTTTIGKNHFHPMRNSHHYEKMEIYDGLPESDHVDEYGTWLAKVAPGVDEHSTGLSWNDRRGKVWPHKPELHPTAWTGQEAVNFLQSYQDQRPFFLKVSFHRPHSPFDPPQHWWDHYGNVDLPKAKVGKWAEQWFGSFTPPRPPEAPRANVGEEEIRTSRQGYYGGISFVDEQIGRILDTLQKRGMMENTLIVFVSDHGEMAGDQHLWRKAWAYEGSSRIPMIVRWGSELLDARRGQVLPQLTELRDVLPTFLDAAGVTIPKHIEGKSLLDLVRGNTTGWRTQLDMEHSTCYYKENVWTALTDGRFKYIFHAYHGVQQLFDLENDPAELNDLAEDPAHAENLKDWRNRMIEHLSLRGEKWVKNGDLVLRTKTINYGINFPVDA